jgi:hypothetical protein
MHAGVGAEPEELGCQVVRHDEGWLTDRVLAYLHDGNERMRATFREMKVEFDKTRV